MLGSQRIRVMEAFGARSALGSVVGPKRFRKNARITPPWETTTRDPSAPE